MRVSSPGFGPYAAGFPSVVMSGPPSTAVAPLMRKTPPEIVALSHWKAPAIPCAPSLFCGLSSVQMPMLSYPTGLTGLPQLEMPT